MINSSQQPRKASQVKNLISRLESQSPPSATSSSRSIADSPRRQPRADAKFEAEQVRRASLTSQCSFDTLKVKSEASSQQDSKQAEGEVPAGEQQDSTAMPPEESLRSQTEAPPHPPVNNPASPTNDQHPSPLDALLSPTTSSLPETPSFPRDSLAVSDLGEVRLDDDELFSTVSLNAAATRDSTVAVKSPIDEEASKPWAEDDEPPPAPSEVSNSTSIRASLLLQRIGNDVPPGPRPSLEGQQKLQEVFERAHRNSKDLEDEVGVDWAFWGSVVSDYQGFASENAEKLARAIEKGIPSNLRGMVWQLMSASKDAEMEATYLKFLKESSPHEKAITRDLGRTFPQHEFFTDGQGIGQENLFNVLKAYSMKI